MSDSIDSAVNRSKNRAAFLGAAVQYLGKDRRHDAEFLADLMLAVADRIAASATVSFAPTHDAASPEVLSDLRDQVHKHAEGIAQVAIRSVTDVYLKVLIVASRALGNMP